MVKYTVLQRLPVVLTVIVLLMHRKNNSSCVQDMVTQATRLPGKLYSAH